MGLNHRQERMVPGKLMVKTNENLGYKALPRSIVHVKVMEVPVLSPRCMLNWCGVSSIVLSRTTCHSGWGNSLAVISLSCLYNILSTTNGLSRIDPSPVVGH